MSSGDCASLLLRLLVDGCALGVLSLLVARRRPRRGLFMVYGTFNLGLFVVLSVISARHVGPAIGFGLFAMLSIVRLRSEPIGNAELACGAYTSPSTVRRFGGTSSRCSSRPGTP
jgi:Domain of unknown function (DUF4956)